MSAPLTTAAYFGRIARMSARARRIRRRTRATRKRMAEWSARVSGALAFARENDVSLAELNAALGPATGDA